MQREVLAIRAGGGMTSRDAAKKLGITPAVLLRLEGKVYGPLSRFGYRATRVFAPSDVTKVRAWLASQRIDSKPTQRPRGRSGRR
jgi:hypothetical protein